MSIQKISTDQLRRMGDQEGLVLQGCGGDLQEWVDGINQILTEEGILKKGARFEEAYTFEHDGLTCLLFPFKEDMQIEVGKLAAWRLETHPNFIGIASQTLRQHHMEEQAAEMFHRITQCQSYDSALSIIGDYVNITSAQQTDEMSMDMC